MNEFKVASKYEEIMGICHEIGIEAYAYEGHYELFWRKYNKQYQVFDKIDQLYWFLKGCKAWHDTNKSTKKSGGPSYY